MKKNRVAGAIGLLSLGTALGLGVRGLPLSSAQAEQGVPLAQPAASVTADPNVYVSLGKKVIPSVVNISTIAYAKGRSLGGEGPGSPEEMFRHFFGGDFEGPGFAPGFRRGPAPRGLGTGPGAGKERVPRAMALGTGFVIDPSGVIVTNNHVVANADEIKIVFTEDRGEKPIEATVIGRDPDLDIALIKVKTDKKLTALPLGDSDALEVGEYVAAVGNPFGEGHSLTHGIVSAKGRQSPEYPLGSWLQTDAPINPGNSGGPLINLKGQVIGINTAIDARAHGIGFAIPINLVKKILPELETRGKVVRGYLGVGIADLNPELALQIGVDKELQAPLVTHVYAKSPAEQAGLRPYDVILEFNGKPVASGAELTERVTAVAVGTKVPMKISRHGREESLSIKLGERPGAQQANRQGQPFGAPESPDSEDQG